MNSDARTTDAGISSLLTARGVKDLIRLIRPEHWIKNGLVLAPVVFALKMTDPRAWLLAGLTAVAFCLVSSSIYIINDISDRESDRLHPKKRNRPIAAGRVSIGTGLTLTGVLFAAGMIVAVLAGLPAAVFAGAYFVLQIAYTAVLKGKVLLDVICIAMGFVLRAVAGAAAIGAVISPWLFICTFTLCLFMGFCKRCNELVTLRVTGNACDHRKTLCNYTPELLTHLITLSAAIAVIAFLTYAASPRTIDNFGTMYLVYTLPIVIYGVFRFAMLSMNGNYADPMDIIVHDRPFQLTIVAWGICVLFIITWGPSIRATFTLGGI